jgi:predicted transcriptional regulator of viral defense system
MTPPTDGERLLDLAHRRGLVSALEVSRSGIHRQALTRLVREGVLERVGRGRYRVTGSQVSEHHGLVLVANAVPHGVVCLLSALSFHEIGTQIPPEVWIAIDRRARRPNVRYPPLHVVRFSSEALTEGIEEHLIEGHEVRVYSIAKTLADLFKYRHKVGLEVALEALREAWHERRVTMDDLDRYARICRVENVIRPYLEAMVA